ncbi:MAG: ABC transporter ATP-binding protein, partial [Syntrophomonas sp.]
MKAVDARTITFRYKGQTSFVLENVFFELEQGQIAAITGPSGCGKSTLGYCLCGLIPKLIKGDFSGEVTVQGRVGIVFQDPDTQIFLPTVEDELAFGPENLCLSREKIGERIETT